MKYTIPITLVLLAAGCARMGTRQGDKSTTVTAYVLDAKTGRTNAITTTETRETTTVASGVALVSSSSTFEGLNASQNGSNQGLKVAKSSQRSDIDRLLDVMGGLARLYGQSQGLPMGQIPPPTTSAPTATAVLKGYKLVPVDDPSVPHLEIQTDAP